MNHLSTKNRLLQIIDDMEIISKELIDNLTKHQKNCTIDNTTLVELLLAKDAEFRSLLSLADEQAEKDRKMDELKAQVEIQDREIQKLQNSLKEAEEMLANAIFQARQKLASIHQANKRPVLSEELIKYAHRISTANAVSAPLNWAIGDLRRPYPTDIEMRNGYLGKSDLNINGGVSTHLTSQLDTQRNISEQPSSFQNQFNWNNISSELHISMGNSGASQPLEARSHKETSQDDVEVMSTDSSSSSSSDSQ